MGEEEKEDDCEKEEEDKKAEDDKNNENDKDEDSQEEKQGDCEEEEKEDCEKEDKKAGVMALQARNGSQQQKQNKIDKSRYKSRFTNGLPLAQSRPLEDK